MSSTQRPADPSPAVASLPTAGEVTPTCRVTVYNRGRKGVACALPAVKDGLCAGHQADRIRLRGTA